MRLRDTEPPVTATAQSSEPGRLIAILHAVVVEIISDETPDLSMPQLGVLLLCSLSEVHDTRVAAEPGQIAGGD